MVNNPNTYDTIYIIYDSSVCVCVCGVWYMLLKRNFFIFIYCVKNLLSIVCAVVLAKRTQIALLLELRPYTPQYCHCRRHYTMYIQW